MDTLYFSSNTYKQHGFKTDEQDMKAVVGQKTAIICRQ